MRASVRIARARIWFVFGLIVVVVGGKGGRGNDGGGG
jgi:hypothetical protein